MVIPNRKSSVFLGGHDLEMQAIAGLLADREDVTVHDARLSWGASASAYRREINDALALGNSIVLVELVDDLPAEVPREKIVVVDHHGPLAGRERPTSIEQIFTLFEFRPEHWTRDLSLVSANDRGHIEGMLEIGATIEEIRSIRARDREAQGITPEQESEGRRAASQAEERLSGHLTIVRLSHDRTATVTDVLDARLGGRGFENLLVQSPKQSAFFGVGRVIEALRQEFVPCWYGGSLPVRGFWGCAPAMPETKLAAFLENHLQ